MLSAAKPVCSCSWAAGAKATVEILVFAQEDNPAILSHLLRVSGKPEQALPLYPRTRPGLTLRLALN